MLRLFLAGCIAIWGVAAHAQEWPTKTVKIIVPFVAGGATDIPARMLAERLSKVWKQPVVVDNRTGAGGTIGAAEAAKSNDGHTLLFPSGAVMTINQYVYSKLPYDPEKDFVPVTNVVAAPQVLVVNANSPYTSMEGIIAAMREKPGKLSFGHAGVGSQSHLANEYFLQQAKVEATGVPYKSDPPAITDILGGIIDFSVINLAPALPHIKSGKLRALGVTSAAEFPLLAGVRPMGAVLPNFENMGWFGMVAPASMPAAVVHKIQADARAQLQDPELRSKLEGMGYAVIGNSPEAMGAAMAVERKRWAAVVKDRNIKPQ